MSFSCSMLIFFVLLVIIFSNADLSSSAPTGIRPLVPVLVREYIRKYQNYLNSRQLVSISIDCSIVSPKVRVIALTVLPLLAPVLSVLLIGAVAERYCVLMPCQSAFTCLSLIALRNHRMCRGWRRLSFVMRTLATKNVQHIA